MKKIKFTKENIFLTLIAILSAVLNFWNLSIEGYANAYYAAAAKSMTMSLKNFFFVAFDPAGFVTIDKPPLGYWLQAISAKIFGFSGWSIILPQALAGLISVIVIYHIVKRSFGSTAGLISSLCLAVTPVFVAASRNNTVDNVLVLALLFACWALSIAAEKGKFKYVLLSMVLIGVGFNIKMLQAYMVIPAIYITYLLSTAVSIKKRILHLVLGTVILIAVSLSWALIVDSIPASSRPYVDSSTNNTEMELILGHNGAERLSLSSSSNNGGGGRGGNGPSGDGQRMKGNPPEMNSSNNSSNPPSSNNSSNSSGNNQMGNPPSGNNSNSSSGNSSGNFQMGNPPGGINGEMGTPPSGDGKMGNMGGGMGGNSSQLSGSFGGQTTQGLTRLFSKNILSDQIVWFIPLAIFGFIAGAIREKLRFRLDNKKKQALVLWFMWFLPVFIYFSFNTGTFHSYYLTMLAPPVAALTGIGITVMWNLFKEGGWKSWFLPAALLTNGAVQLLMLTYFISYSGIVKILMVLLIILCFGSSVLLIIANLIKKKDPASELKIVKYKKALLSLALTGLLITPFVGSAAVLFYPLNSSFPAAGLELLSGSSREMGMGTASDSKNSSNSKLIQFLLKNKTKNQKYLLVVSNANSASEIIVQTGEPVMAIGGFLGSDKSITLDEFKALVKKGEIRYVMTGGNGGGGSSSTDIMSWVQKVGTLVSSSKYSDSAVTNSNQGNSQTTGSNSSQTTNQTYNQNSSTQTNAQTNNQTNSSSTKSGNRMMGGDGGGMSGQLYDLKAYTDSLSAK